MIIIDMKKVWVVFSLVMILLIGKGLWKKTNIRNENLDSRQAIPKIGKPKTHYPETLRNKNNSGKEKIVKTNKGQLPEAILRDSLVNFALKHQGTPYEIAGTSNKGFDCSGFVNYTFAHFGIQVARSSEMLAQEGISVTAELAQKADVVIFTGTHASDTTPGHVGIVISNKNEPIRFVHSSSNGGVKISAIDSTGYEKRFLQVRRLF